MHASPYIRIYEVRPLVSRRWDYEAGLTNALRTVPTFVTAHTFCASRDTRIPIGGAYSYRDIFARFVKVLLVSKKKIGGNRAFFRDKKASILNKTPYISLCFAVF